MDLGLERNFDDVNLHVRKVHSSMDLACTSVFTSFDVRSVLQVVMEHYIFFSYCKRGDVLRQKLRKIVELCQSYAENTSGFIFSRHDVIEIIIFMRIHSVHRCNEPVRLQVMCDLRAFSIAKF